MGTSRIVAAGLVALGTGVATGLVALPSPAALPAPDLLVQGTVAQAAAPGPAAPVAGSEVRVSWIPGLAGADVGDELTPTTVAVVHTDAHGRYHVHVDPNPAMERAAAANNGWVSFDVSATSGDLRSSGTSTSRRLAGGSWVQASPRAAMAGQPTAVVDAGDDFGAVDDVDFTFSAPTATRGGQAAGAPAARTSPGREGAEMRYPAVDGSTLGSTAPGTATVTAAATGSVPCSFVVTGTPRRSVRVLNWHNAGNGNATWTYGTSADSDLDVAFDGSGDGTWSLRGGFHVGNKVGSTVSQTVRSAFNQYGRTQFRFTEGYYKPFGLGGWCNDDRSIPVWSKRKTATKWVAGVGNDAGSGARYQGCSVAPQAGFRSSFRVGSRFTKATTTATRISAAADVGPINIGGTSGFSTQLDVSWSAVRGTGIFLCGKRDDITGAPGVIHAQNR